MKKGIVIIIVLLVAAVIWGVSIYNGFVTKEETVEQAVGDVEAAYQKRADQIPNVVATAKEYSDYEGEAFKNIVEARSKAASTTINMAGLNEQQLENYQKMQDEILNTMRANLNVIVEQYPDLKASALYLKLQNDIESCENDISAARRNFNAKAKEFNETLRKFPNRIIAGMFGFETKPYFKASEGAEKAPDVKELFK